MNRDQIRDTRIRELIRNYRQARGLTQAEVAGRVGLSRIGYNRIEVGVRRLSERELEAIGEAIGFNTTELLREAGFTAIKGEKKSP